MTTSMPTRLSNAGPSVRTLPIPTVSPTRSSSPLPTQTSSGSSSSLLSPVSPRAHTSTNMNTSLLQPYPYPYPYSHHGHNPGPYLPSRRHRQRAVLQSSPLTGPAIVSPDVSSDDLVENQMQMPTQVEVDGEEGFSAMSPSPSVSPGVSRNASREGLGLSFDVVDVTAIATTSVETSRSQASSPSPTSDTDKNGNGKGKGKERASPPPSTTTRSLATPPPVKYRPNRISSASSITQDADGNFIYVPVQQKTNQPYLNPYEAARVSFYDSRTGAGANGVSASASTSRSTSAHSLPLPTPTSSITRPASILKHHSSTSPPSNPSPHLLSPPTLTSHRDVLHHTPSHNPSPLSQYTYNSNSNPDSTSRPPLSRDPRQNWMTSDPVPTFSREKIKLGGVVMPVRAPTKRTVSAGVGVSTSAAEISEGEKEKEKQVAKDKRRSLLFLRPRTQSFNSQPPSTPQTPSPPLTVSPPHVTVTSTPASAAHEHASEHENDDDGATDIQLEREKTLRSLQLTRSKSKNKTKSLKRSGSGSGSSRKRKNSGSRKVKGMSGSLKRAGSASGRVVVSAPGGEEEREREKENGMMDVDEKRPKDDSIATKKAKRKSFFMTHASAFLSFQAGSKVAEDRKTITTPTSTSTPDLRLVPQPPSPSIQPPLPTHTRQTLEPESEQTFRPLPLPPSTAPSAFRPSYPTQIQMRTRTTSNSTMTSSVTVPVSIPVPASASASAATQIPIPVHTRPRPKSLIVVSGTRYQIPSFSHTNTNVNASTRSTVPVPLSMPTPMLTPDEKVNGRAGAFGRSFGFGNGNESVAKGSPSASRRSSGGGKKVDDMPMFTTSPSTSTSTSTTSISTAISTSASTSTSSSYLSCVNLPTGLELALAFEHADADVDVDADAEDGDLTVLGHDHDHEHEDLDPETALSLEGTTLEDGALSGAGYSYGYGYSDTYVPEVPVIPDSVRDTMTRMGDANECTGNSSTNERRKGSNSSSFETEHESEAHGVPVLAYVAQATSPPPSSPLPSAPVMSREKGGVKDVKEDTKEKEALEGMKSLNEKPTATIRLLKSTASSRSKSRTGTYDSQFTATSTSTAYSTAKSTTTPNANSTTWLSKHRNVFAKLNIRFGASTVSLSNANQHQNHIDNSITNARPKRTNTSGSSRSSLSSLNRRHKRNSRRSSVTRRTPPHPHAHGKINATRSGKTTVDSDFDLDIGGGKTIIEDGSVCVDEVGVIRDVGHHQNGDSVRRKGSARSRSRSRARTMGMGGVVRLFGGSRR